jgi:hypothetical protein
MTKTPWEARVGMLLDPHLHPDDFKYSFKPVDSAMYGGQTRIDWHAADALGRYWMIEVKSLAKGRVSLNLAREVSPGQRLALNAVADTYLGVPLLAIGDADGTLRFYDWRKIRWLADILFRPLLTPSQSSASIIWTGPKIWKMISLPKLLESIIPGPTMTMTLPSVAAAAMGAGYPAYAGSPPPPGLVMPPGFEGGLPEALQNPSPSTLKPKDSTRTRRRKLLSEQSSRR